MSYKKKRIGIIGAGISGLTVGYYLNKAGLEVRIYEAEGGAGGKLKTERRDGYIVDIGPNTALETTPLFRELFQELQIEDKVLYASDTSQNRYILRSNILHNLPMKPVEFLNTKLFSTRAKFRLMREPFIGRSKKEESVAEFVVRRIGKEFLDYAINPFVAGVYAGKPEKLSVRYAFPKLYRLEERYGSLILGSIRGAKERKERAEKAKIESRIFSFRGGMQHFPDVMAASLDGLIKVKAPAKRIYFDKKKYIIQFENKEIEDEVFDLIIISTPAYNASSLIAGFAPALASHLDSIEYPPVAVVVTAYRIEDLGFKEKGFGFLVPEIEKRAILGTLWNSYMFDKRAPENYVLFTTFIGGSRQPELAMKSDEELLLIVSSELLAIMGIHAKPEMVCIKKWPRAIPQYTLGYGAVLNAIEEFRNAHPGVYICANYIGGIALGDCIMSARRVADAIIFQVHAAG